MSDKKKKKANLKVLQVKSTRLIRQEYMDYDYIDKLSPEEKQWLADFTAEHYNASVGKQKDEGQYNRFYRSKEMVKESQNTNNQRNRDLFGKKRARRELDSLNNLGLEKDDPHFAGYRKVDKDSTEDALIKILDHKRQNFDDSSEDSD